MKELFAKHELYAKKVVKTALNRIFSNPFKFFIKFDLKFNCAFEINFHLDFLRFFRIVVYLRISLLAFGFYESNNYFGFILPYFTISYHSDYSLVFTVLSALRH